MSLSDFDKRLKNKITSQIVCDSIQIENVSEFHAHHSSSPNTGHSHYNIRIVSDHFQDKSRLMRHKIIYGILESELREQIHALSLELLTKKEEKIEN